MKHVIRYMLEGDGSVPKFVVDGGYFPLGDELVGISVDDTKRYLPDSVYKLTKSDIISRIVAPSNSTITATDIANAWLASKGMEDLK